MISLSPENLADAFMKRKGVYPDPTIYEVRDFVQTQEITTGESYVSFNDINTYFIRLTHDTFNEVEKLIKEQLAKEKLASKGRRKTDAQIDSEIRALLNQKDNRFIFKINRFTKYVGIDIKTLRVFIGYSHKSRRLLGISTLEIGTYNCFSDEDSIYLPVMHIKEFLEDVEREAKTRKTKRIAHLFQRALDPLYDLQKHIEKSVYPIHDMYRFNKVRDQIRDKMLAQLAEEE